jgi:hypothetical protein
MEDAWRKARYQPPPFVKKRRMKRSCSVWELLVLILSMATSEDEDETLQHLPQLYGPFRRVVNENRPSNPSSAPDTAGNARFALSEFPSPYLEGLLPVDPERSTYAETVRGCKSHCTFCFYPCGSNVLLSLNVDASAPLAAAGGSAGPVDADHGLATAAGDGINGLGGSVLGWYRNPIPNRM